MSVSTMPTPQIDLLALLQRQNHYQRLGLKTNAVTAEEIEAAYGRRVKLLQDCASELTGETSVAAIQLIDQAYEVLRNEDRRREYNSFLENRHRWRGTSAPGKRVESGNSTAADPGNKISPSPKMVLGRYEVGEVLYEGQRATLYEATDTRIHRPVVIKRVRQELSHTADYLRMFREEAEQFARFTSGHLVKVLDYDPATGALVLEKLQCDLRSLIKSRGCDWQIAIEILADCLGGLMELQSAGMTHSRLDLSHIMLDPHGGAKLATTPGIRRGSQALLPGAQSRYLAPELLNPTVFGEPGPNADLYSLGFIVLELMVGSSFAERVSKAIEDDQENPTSWLQWHASPTDHLPAIETLVPSLPASFVELLRRMTSKQQHERYQTAAECLQAVRDIQTSDSGHDRQVAWTPPERDKDEGIELLGNPAPLHSPYELPAALTWGTLIKDPAALFRPEAARHRMFLLAGVGIAAVMMIVLGSRPNAQQGTASAETRDEETASYRSLGDLTEESDEALNESSLFESGGATSEEADADPTDNLPPTDLSDTIDLDEATKPLVAVTFQVKPSGQVLEVRSLDATDESLDGPREMAGTWALQPGRYAVHYQWHAGQKGYETEITVPAGKNAIAFVLQIDEIANPNEVAAAPAEQPEKSLPKSHLRTMIPFPVIATGIASESQLSNSLDNYLRKFSLLQATRIPDLVQRAKASGARDPRISFAYALQAMRDRDRNLAVEQCYRALREAEHFRVPYILPLELLCHLELQNGGRGLQTSLAACLDTLHWIRKLERETHDPRLEKSMEDLAWWTGTVVSFIELTRNEEARALVDLDTPKELYQEQLGSRCTELFIAANLVVREKHTSLHNRHLARLEKLHEREIWEQIHAKTMQERHELRERDKQLYENTRRQAPWIAAMQSNQENDPYEGMKLLSESGSQLRSQLAGKPQRHYGGLSSPATFSNYVPMDVSNLARLTHDTLPKIQTPNLARR